MAKRSDDAPHDNVPAQAGDSFLVGRRLAHLVVQKVVVPIIAAGLMDLDEVIELIKRGVVAALEGRGASNSLLAAHVSRSRRWFQKYLKAARTEASPQAEDSSADGSSSETGPLVGPGYQFMLSVLQVCMARYPEPVSLQDVRAELDLPDWHIEEAELRSRLNLYSELGVLRPVEGNGGTRLYRAPSRVVSDVPEVRRLENLGRRLGWVFPLALAHCEGRGDFAGIVAELSPGALERARKRMRAATAEIIADAVEETHKSEDPVDSNVQVRVIIAFGNPGEEDEH